MEKLESDVTKYRQKAEDVEYLKKRVLVSYNCIHVYPQVHSCNDYSS